MRIDGDNVLFSTGKVLSANMGRIGIDPEAENITEGYDGGFFSSSSHPEEKSLTPGECVELADHMIDTWRRFRAAYAAVPDEGERS